MVEPLFFDDFVKNGEHFLDTFDEYFRLSFTAAEFKQITSKFGSEKVDPNTKLSQLMKKCFQLFATGLGERFEQIGYHFSDKSGGTLKIAERLKRKEKINVLIGFRVTQLWNNPLTVGPVANDPSAREFRTFWHGGSALRRFADSRVCECMVWGEEPSPAVVKTILRFLLIKNFGLTDEAVAWKSSFYDPTVVKKHNDEINTAFSSLSTALRSLKNLSLSVTNIHGVSPFLRGTEPQCELTKAAIGGKLQEGRYLPTSHLLPKFTPTVEVFIKMAYSTKWGDNVEAIKKLTAAFYLQIAEQLKTSHKLIAVPTEEHLYVVQDEIVFRLIIVNDKLQRLLEGRVNSLKENGASRIKATPEGRAHSSFQKKFVSELQLASSLHSFSLKSSFFSSTVQLFKLWLGAHQMSGILTDFATELLVAAALGCKDKSEPGSSLCAFRRCLKLLAKHSWLSQPLFVDFDSQWTHEELDNLELNFIKMRPVLPPMVIITNEDHLGNKWTKDPSPQMLKRLVALATNSLRIIDEGLTKEAVVDLLGSVTQSTFKNYDLVLSCHRKMVTRAVEMVENGELKGLPVVDFDPVTDLVVALQNSLGSVALFFYNKYGSDKIAVKFKPIGEGVPAKVSRSGDNLTKSREKVHPSREEIIEKIEVMGKSIIRSIEKNF